MTQITSYTVTASHPLPLEGAGNVRDLGGYPVGNLGAETRTSPSVFLRADALAELTENDIEILKSHRLTTVIDLRSSFEIQAKPDPFGAGSPHPEIREEQITLLDQMNSSSFATGLPSSMAELYISLLDKQAKELGRVVTMLADAPGCALFHCSAGKDRTGVVAMLLLKAADVPDAAIVADYAATERYMGERFSRQRAELERAGITVPDAMFASKPQSMEQALEHLASSYGSVERYLTEYADCPRKSIDVIKAKLLGGNL